MRRGSREVEHLVAPHEVAAAEVDAGQLLLGADDTAQGESTFGVEEIAVGPARFEPRSLARAVAELPGDGVRWRGLELHRKIDGAALVDGDQLDVGAGHEGGRDETAAEVIDLRLLELVAGLEAGDGLD